MHTTSQAFRDLMAQPSRTLAARGRITFPDFVHYKDLTSVEMISFEVSENAGEHLPLGGTAASSVTLTLDNRQGEWDRGGSIRGSYALDGAELKLELGVWDGTQFIYEKIGTYLLEDANGQEQETAITISGADYLANKAVRTFIDGTLSYPMTLKQMAQAACFQAGIPMKAHSFKNDSRLVQKPVWGETLPTCRDVFGYIACLAGGFARIDRNGELEIVPFETDAELTIGTDRYISFDRQAVAFGPLNALIIRPFGAPEDAEDMRIAVDDSLVNTALNSITIGNNPLLRYGSSDLASLANAIALSGMMFDGCSVKWQGDPSLCTGDCIQVTDLAGHTYKLLITEQRLRFDAGFAMTSGNRIKTEANYSGNQNRLIVDGKLNVKMLSEKIYSSLIANAAIQTAHIEDASITDAKIDTAQIENLKAIMLHAVSARIDYLIANNLMTDELYAAVARIAQANLTTAVIGSADIAWGEITDLTTQVAQIAKAQISTANIDAANINWADITTLNTAMANMVTAEIQTADIDHGHIKDLTTDTAIITRGVGDQLYISRLAVTEANMVSLTVGELVVRGHDGRFYAVTVNESGEIHTVLKQINNDDVQDVSINGDTKLIENSVTAKTLNAQNIFVDNAVIKAMIAANLDVDTLFAREAMIGRIDTAHIKTGAVTADLISAGAKDQLALQARQTVQPDLDAFNTRMGEAEIKLSPDAIVQTVTQSSAYTQRQQAIDSGIAETATAAENAQETADTANEGVATLVGRVDTVEQRMTPEAITSTVRASERYLSDLAGKADASTIDGLATKTELLQTQQTVIEQTNNSIHIAVKQERDRAQAVEGEIRRFTDTAQTYFQFTLDGLLTGKSDSPFKTLSGNEKYSFLQDGVEVAYIQYNKLFIKAAHILELLTIGGPSTGYTDIMAVQGGIKAKWRAS